MLLQLNHPQQYQTIRWSHNNNQMVLNAMPLQHISLEKNELLLLLLLGVLFHNSILENFFLHPGVTRYYSTAIDSNKLGELHQQTLFVDWAHHNQSCGMFVGLWLRAEGWDWLLCALMGQFGVPVRWKLTGVCDGRWPSFGWTQPICFFKGQTDSSVRHFLNVRQSPFDDNKLCFAQWLQHDWFFWWARCKLKGWEVTFPERWTLPLNFCFLRQDWFSFSFFFDHDERFPGRRETWWRSRQNAQDFKGASKKAKEQAILCRFVARLIPQKSLWKSWIIISCVWNHLFCEVDSLKLQGWSPACKVTPYPVWHRTLFLFHTLLFYI